MNGRLQIYYVFINRWRVNLKAPHPNTPLRSGARSWEGTNCTSYKVMTKNVSKFLPDLIFVEGYGAGR